MIANEDSWNSDEDEGGEDGGAEDERSTLPLSHTTLCDAHKGEGNVDDDRYNLFKDLHSCINKGGGEGSDLAKDGQ